MVGRSRLLPVTDVTVTWRDVIAPDRTGGSNNENRSVESKPKQAASLKRRVIVQSVSFMWSEGIHYARHSEGSLTEPCTVDVRNDQRLKHNGIVYTAAG